MYASRKCPWDTLCNGRVRTNRVILISYNTTVILIRRVVSVSCDARACCLDCFRVFFFFFHRKHRRTPRVIIKAPCVHCIVALSARHAGLSFFFSSVLFTSSLSRYYCLLLLFSADLEKIFTTETRAGLDRHGIRYGSRGRSPASATSRRVTGTRTKRTVSARRRRGDRDR